MNKRSIEGHGAIGSIVIVGGGTAGWMTAAACSRYLADGARSITLVESDEIGTVGVGEATIPPIINFNRMLDIDENAFLKATKGTFKLGIEFVNWGQQGDRYFHPFGAYGEDLHGVPFHQLWLREKHLGEPGQIADYCISAAAAAARRFGRPVRDPKSPLARLFYAFHFDAGLYAAFLRQIAERQGAKRQEGRIVKVHRHSESGDVTSVELEGGRLVEGDLFVDCSGFAGLLTAKELETPWRDWSHWLPADRAIAVPTANVGTPDPFTRSTAHGAGWQWRIPLQHRTGNGHVFSSRFMDEDAARDILLANLEGAALADPRTIRFATGRREQAWSHNVVAIGLSSGFLEPLESTSIHLIQNGIQRLLALFPGKPISPVERDEYNRGMADLFDDIRDFIILHYKATQRDDTAFWRYVRDMEIPDTLARKIDLWRLHGRVFREGADLFNVTSWVAVLLGQNIAPSAYDPVVDSLDESRVSLALRQMREGYARAAQSLPVQEEFLRRAGAWAEEPQLTGAW
ncbi:tryptophan halogenase family protein [Erythrobacter sp. EC-HK427]|uniref:tryptophan halogenase family protein n=1 Tax=Erythrobacter sp. EC-HK427 TaxID=2038396 RepID=UPI001251DB23|nr:tryptophan halogenase family protein [Erythrobacter sp. EC-HK427]VVT01163.1 Tryptophan halogenase [Erythrobacter sp. EC-HK427]